MSSHFTVEHHVGFEFFDCIANRKEFVLHAERACFVSELPKTLHDVELGFEGERLLRREPIE